MSENLLTCPDCGHAGFTERGLQAHRGNKTCLKRQGGAGVPPAEEGILPDSSSELTLIESAPVVMMNEKDARIFTHNLKIRLEDIRGTENLCRSMLYEVQSREGWRALGYPDFVAYAKAEFSISKTHTYRLANAGKYELLLHREVTLTQSEVAELSRLPDDAVARVWTAANASGRPKPAALKDRVNEALGIKPKKKRTAKKKSPTDQPRHFGESVQVVLKPALGVHEATWKPKSAAGVTVILRVNRDTDLPKLLTEALSNIQTMAEAAIIAFSKSLPANPASQLTSVEPTSAARAKVEPPDGLEGPGLGGRSEQTALSGSEKEPHAAQDSPAEISAS